MSEENKHRATAAAILPLVGGAANVTSVAHCMTRLRLGLRDRSLVQELLKTYYEPRQIPLRGCQPRDLIDQALSLAEYLAAPRELSRDLLESACASYFVDERESPVVYS